MKRLWLLPVVILMVLLNNNSSGVQAQSGDTVLQPGQPVIVTVASGQAVTRTFSVLAGDFFELKLSRLAEYTYSAVLIGPDQNAMPLLPGPNGNVDQVFDRAALGGTYTLVIQATDGTGDMLIQLDTNAVAPQTLAMGQTTVTLEADTIRYSLTPPDSTTQTTLMVQVVLPQGVPQPFQFGLPSTKLIEQNTGDTVLAVTASKLPQVAAVLTPGTSYTLTFEPGSSPIDLLISWVEGAGTTANLTGSATPNATVTLALTAGPSALPSTGACFLSFSSGVNVRPGPSTAYNPPIGTTAAGQTLPVTGRNASGDWYQVNFNGRTGWVSVGLSSVSIGGDCSNLQVMAAPPLPTAPPAPPTLTPAHVLTGTPAVSVTPSVTPEPGVQTAPPDGNYSLSIPFMASASISDFVSYPSGDTQDTVFYEITNMNAQNGDQTNIQITATCSGEGSEYIQFSTGGQSFGCGETVVNRDATYDTRTGSIVVTATGGNGTYVQWQLYGQSLAPLKPNPILPPIQVTVAPAQQ